MREKSYGIHVVKYGNRLQLGKVTWSIFKFNSPPYLMLIWKTMVTGFMFSFMKTASNLERVMWLKFKCHILPISPFLYILAPSMYFPPIRIHCFDCVFVCRLLFYLFGFPSTFHDRVLWFSICFFMEFNIILLILIRIWGFLCNRCNLLCSFSCFGSLFIWGFLLWFM